MVILLELHPISYEDKTLINYYSNFITTNSYEYSFTSLYLWKDLCLTNIGVIYNTLVIQKYDEEKGFFFMMPYYENIESLYKSLDYLKSNYTNFQYLLGDIDDNHIELLKSNYNLEIFKNNNSSEYIYLTDDLINLKGNKYHKKRNHYNNFINLYNYTTSSIDNEKIINDCLNLVDEWRSKKTINSKELLLEDCAIENILYSLDDLKLKSIAIYIDNKLAGFAIGENYKNSAIIYIEKCISDYRGIYAFINNEFLKSSFSNTIYVNRQEDCGHAGLKKSKESYHPYKLLNKYFVKIK